MRSHIHAHGETQETWWWRYILIVTCTMSRLRSVFIIIRFYYLISREGSSSFGKNNGARNQALPRSVARLVPKLFFVSKSREKACAYVDFPSRSEGKRNNGSVNALPSPSTLPRNRVISLPRCGRRFAERSWRQKKIIYLWYETLQV